MIDENSMVAPARDQVCCDLPGELLILQTDSGVYYGLNEVGKRVWTLLGGGTDEFIDTPVNTSPKRVAEIRDAILAEFDVDRHTCTRDLLGLLEKLASKRLIEVKSAPLA